MDLTKLSMGRNPPWDFNALIEVPVGGVPVKYEFDKSSGFIQGSTEQIRNESPE